MHFAPTDYFGSPRVRQLIHERKFEPVLAYLHFLFSQFIHQKPIRFENAAGAFNLPGTDAEEILKILTAGDPPLIRYEGGMLWNERVQLDLEAAFQALDRASENGRRGAKARYSGGVSKSDEDLPSTRMATLWPPHSSPTCTPHSSPPPPPTPTPPPTPKNERASRVTADAVREACDRYLQAFNRCHGRKHKPTPTLLRCIEACLKAEPAYSADEIVAAGIMTWGDEWYAEREPSYPVRFRRAGKQDGKSHIDDLLAQVAPGKRFAPQIIEIVHELNMTPFFKERTKR